MRHFCDIGLHNCNFLLDYNDLTLFAGSVQVFLFVSVRAFPSCLQRLGCYSDQNAR